MFLITNQSPWVMKVFGKCSKRITQKAEESFLNNLLHQPQSLQRDRAAVRRSIKDLLVQTHPRATMIHSLNSKSWWCFSCNSRTRSSLFQIPIESLDSRKSTILSMLISALSETKEPKFKIQFNLQVLNYKLSSQDSQLRRTNQLTSLRWTIKSTSIPSFNRLLPLPPNNNIFIRKSSPWEDLNLQRRTVTPWLSHSW